MGNEILLWGVKENGESTFHGSWSRAQRRFRYLTGMGKSPELFTVTEDRLREWQAAAEQVIAPTAVTELKGGDFDDLD